MASGKGGAGAVSFRREAMVARGGPDGGDGGRGGDLVLEVDPRIHSLLDLRFKKNYKAPDGDPGSGRNRSGLDGKALILKVPPGTIVKTSSGETLFDLNEPGFHVLLKGGLGGKGNVFYKSSVNQAPSVAQKGLHGEEMTIRLELKLLADVGIMGLPNAGKSTLISRLSSAKPKIADYPFTTLVPNLGVVRFKDELSYVVADIPGLVAGAHEGVGLGTQFLRHIERCRVLVHLIDIGAGATRPVEEVYQEIRSELELYDKAKSVESDYKDLSSRPEIVVLNKIDSANPDVLGEALAKLRAQGLSPFKISCATGAGLDELREELGRRVFSEPK